ADSRQKAFAFTFNSTDIAWGNPGALGIDGKFEISIDLSETPVGRGPGYTRHDLFNLLFNDFVRNEVIKELMMAMVLVTDVEAQGPNEINGKLVVDQVHKVYSLIGKSAQHLGML